MAQPERNRPHSPFDPDLLSADIAKRSICSGSLARTAARFGRRPLGTLIVSMTHSASDLLTMLWLSRVGAVSEGLLPRPCRWCRCSRPLPTSSVPTAFLRQLFQQPDYLKLVRPEPQGQICMIGYSDSVKDGGYLAANWHSTTPSGGSPGWPTSSTCRSPFSTAAAEALGPRRRPGRPGGALLAPDSVRGRLRVTEQGEIVAERYADPPIAHRHLEQLSWATLLVTADISSRIPTGPGPNCSAKPAAHLALAAYRRLVEDPDLPAYFRSATPIEVIESLPIGSRPSRRERKGRRKGGKTIFREPRSEKNSSAPLDQLRAIPFTFAWTQSRHLLTGYYGLGSGLAAVVGENWDILRRMYEEWPFFCRPDR